MPYLHLDLPATYPVQVKRELPTRLCKLYAEVMETQLWRPNVGIADSARTISITWVPTALSQSPWSWSSSHRIRGKRSCATATGPQIGPPPRLFRAEARENAERGQSFGEYLEIFDHFYADDIEGTTDTMKEPVHSRAGGAREVRARSAREDLPYSHATRGNVPVTLEVIGKEASAMTGNRNEPSQLRRT